MMTEAEILYQRGPYWLARATFKRSTGYRVWCDGVTHATHVATIGYPGADGLRRGMEWIDRKYAEDPRAESVRR